LSSNANINKDTNAPVFHFNTIGLDVSAFETANLTVIDTNDDPEAVADSNSGNEDQGAISGSVLANDHDANAGDVLTVSNAGVYEGDYGTLTLNTDGTYSYVIDADAVQSLKEGESVHETFAYAITDGQGGAASSALTVTVTGSNDGPVAAADTVAVN